MVAQPRPGIGHALFLHAAVQHGAPGHGICCVLYAWLCCEEADIAGWLLPYAEHAHGAVGAKVHALLHALDALNVCRKPSCTRM